VSISANADAAVAGDFEVSLCVRNCTNRSVFNDLLCPLQCVYSLVGFAQALKAAQRRSDINKVSGSDASGTEYRLKRQSSSV